MRKPIFLAPLLLACSIGAAADLTPQETRWLSAAAPVIAYSRELKLPLDIIVQPQARPGDVPLGMGFDGGRCKLVLSLRGNPDAEGVLAGVPDDHKPELIEAMAAHEVAHCWRHSQGVWNALPAGFVEVGEETANSSELLAASRAMRETRREEAYADLAALAWTRHRHPSDYGRVYAWLEKLRQKQPVARAGHDTRAWVRLASDGARFGAAARPFEDAAPLWREGLLSSE
jgi:ADP-ribose pyrophosphatase YjhB (NUDIX family)